MDLAAEEWPFEAVCHLMSKASTAFRSTRSQGITDDYAIPSPLNSRLDKPLPRRDDAQRFVVLAHV
jgi:hypothetical protein